MVSEYHYTQSARQPGSKWKVYIDPVSLYGFFEHDDEGEGGGLWFEKHQDDGKLELVDYDGAFELPMSVIKSIKSLGHLVDEVFMN